MQKSAIIDTSVLICLHHLNLLKSLFLIYNKVYIPRAVEKEFLEKHPNPLVQSERFAFLEKFYFDNSIWFIKCQAYRTELIELYKTDNKLDEGESEVFAQNQELGSNNTLLLDETQARKVATKNKLAKNGVLYILAIFDLKLKICNYFVSVKLLTNQLNTRFSEKIIHFVYNECKKESF